MAALSDCAILHQYATGFPDATNNATACCGVGFQDKSGAVFSVSCLKQNPDSTTTPTENIHGIYFSGADQLFYGKNFPSWLAQFSELGVLFLNNTGLVGELPAQMPPNLYEIHIEDNYLTGSLAPIAALKNMQYMHVSNNYFTGNLDFTQFVWYGKQGTYVYDQNCLDNIVEKTGTTPVGKRDDGGCNAIPATAPALSASSSAAPASATTAAASSAAAPATTTAMSTSSAMVSKPTVASTITKASVSKSSAPASSTSTPSGANSRFKVAAGVVAMFAAGLLAVIA